MLNLTPQLQALVLALVTLVQSVWYQVDPIWPRTRDAQEIAVGIALVVVEDRENPPVFTSHDEDAEVMAYWGLRESGLDKHAIGDGGRSHGVWQQRTAAGFSDSVSVQGRSELRLLRQGKLMCPGSPAAILWGGCHVRVVFHKNWSDVLANRRIMRGRELLAGAISESDAVADLR